MNEITLVTLAYINRTPPILLIGLILHFILTIRATMGLKFKSHEIEVFRRLPV